MDQHLSHHHRNTVEQIFNHPSGGNIEWRSVVSLLESVGSVEQGHNGKLKVAVGPETEVLTPPRDKDIDPQTVVDLRRMLTEAGYAPGSPGVEDERSRDYGDNRRGEPTET